MSLFDFYNDYGLTYNQAFAYEYACKGLLLSACCLAGTSVFYIASKFVKSTTRNSLVASELEKDQEGVDFNASFNQIRSLITEHDKASNDPAQSMITALESMSLIGSWLTIFAFAITPSILSGLSVIPTFLAVILTLLIFFIKFIVMVYWYCPAFLKKKSTTQSYLQDFLRKAKITTIFYRYRFGTFFIFALLYSIIVPHLTQDMCMNFYNEGYGSNYRGFGVSTRFSRYFQLDTVCPKGKICQAYATLPEETDTAVILNVHTGPDVSSIEIRYDDKSFTAQSYFLDIEERGARYVHSTLINGLEPYTFYHFQVFYNGKVQDQINYRTLPSKDMEEDMILAAGGDAGTTKTAWQMTAVLGNYNPDTIIVGGDISYDNGMPSCYYSMDLFLRMFNTVYENAGRIVPLMFSIGNHDIGFNAFQDGVVDITKNMYYIFFPHETKINKEGKTVIPDLHERKSYSYHALGNTVHFALDSGYMLKYDGEQENFIRKISEQYLDRVKMANFHVPVTPTCFFEQYDDIRTITDPQKYWAPLFEQYKFASVFENHVHMYKKTFPLTEGAKKISDKGVVYFGDGNWGISPNSCQKNPENLNYTKTLEAMSNVTHVWLIKVTKTSLTHFAVDKENHLFDKEYVFDVKDYVTSNVTELSH